MQANTTYKTIDLSHLGLLQVSGSGAKQLLQGQLTCDLNTITANQSRLGAHCNPQGRIISLFRIFFYQNSYYLQMPSDLLAVAFDALQKYAVFFKAELLDASTAFQRILYQGTQLADISLPNQIDEAIYTHDVLIIKAPGSIPTFEIIGEPAAIANLGITRSTTHALNDYKFAIISAGIPSIYAHTSGKFLPHELNLQALNGVSFEKGCYTGQEIIARMHYKGQLKKHLYRATVKTKQLPQPGDDIYSDGPCAIIVDSCKENETTVQMLVVANETDVESKQLFLDPAKTQPVEFNTLPLGGSHV